MLSKLQPQITVTIIVALVGAMLIGGLAGFYGAELRRVLEESDNSAARLESSSSDGILEINEKGEVAVPPSVISEEELTIQTVARASDSVVSIIVEVEQPVFERSVEKVRPFGEGSPFVFEVPRLNQAGTERQAIGAGSGFFVSSDGLVMTNKHVVEREDAFYKVVTGDGKELEAKVIDRDPFNDLAVVKVDGAGFPALAFGDSDKIRIGQRVIAIGYALGRFSNSVSTGIVSGIGRNIRAATGGGQIEALSDLIQTDAAINQGNSGGPLLDIHGKVIAVNVAVAQGSENIGFAIPVNAVKPVLASVKTHGRIVRPQLGVRYVMLTPELARQNELLRDYGALILAGDSEPAVIPDSPAELAGLKSEDIILEIDGKRLDSGYTLGDAIMEHGVGDTITLKILREEQELNLQAVLSEWQR